MKKLLTILFILLALVVNAQDPNPLPSITVKRLISPNDLRMYYDTSDSIVKGYKGVYGWTWFISKGYIEKYYVPYNNALYNVNLGDKRISSTKQRLPIFNGACVIPTILDNGDGSITVGDGEYHLSTNVEGRGSENFLVSGGTFTLTNNVSNYLVADYNSGNPIVKVITDVNLINETTVVPVFTAYRNNNYLHTQHWDALGVALANKIHQSIVKTQRYRRESGLAIAEVPTRYLTLSSGVVWVGAVRVSVDAINTQTNNLFLWYHSGGNWTTTITTQYNNSQYDNGTNLVELTANRYAVNWIYRGIESQKHMYIVLGTEDYTLAQAQEAKVPTIPTAISSHAMLVAKLIVQKSGDAALSLQSVFDPQFTVAAAGGSSVHNDLTGRDAIEAHPASSISFTPASTITSTDSYNAILESLSDAKDYADTKDPSTSNELNTSISFNTSTKELSITDPGGTHTTTITISGSNIINAFTNTLPITSETTVVTFPTAMTYENYRPILRVWYNKNINGKDEEIINSVYDFTKTVNGFSFKVDTVAGYFFYLAVDTTNIYPITVDNFVAVADSINGYVTPYQLSSYGFLTTEVDGSITNEIQTLSNSSSGTTRTITISSGNSIGFDIADADASATNEIQDLSGSGSTLSGYQISLSSDASPVTLPNEADGSTTNEIQHPTLSGNNIGLTSTSTTIDISQATAVLANTAKVTNATHTGDVTGTTTLTIATVNSNIGTYNNVTINAKGQAIAGSNVSYLQNVVEDTTPQLGGDLELNSKSILYNSTLSSNSTWSGEVISGTAGENLVIGDFVYYKFSDGKYWKAKADAYATARCAGIATASISANASGTILIRGTMRYDAWNWTAAEVWLDAATAGAGTSTQPSTTGNQIQYIARALTADVLFFNPSNDIGEK